MLNNESRILTRPDTRLPIRNFTSPTFLPDTHILKKKPFLLCISLGLRGAGTVPVAEEERRAFQRMAEGNLRRQQETASGLRQVFEGVVRLFHVAMRFLASRAPSGRNDGRMLRKEDVCMPSSPEVEERLG